MTVRPRQETPVLLQVDAILGRLVGAAAIEELCRFLHSELPGYDWVGVYRREAERLELVGYAGEEATEHTSIAIGEGLCGRAAREGATVLVADVRESPDYLACFASTRSEIVVPIRSGGAVIGEIDVDGNALGAFDGSDRRLLEAIAGRLVTAVNAARPLAGA